MKTHSSTRYVACFGRRPEAVYFSPGRVNLIGEHTDYNGGMVLPVAIDLGNTFSIGRSGDDYINIVSPDFPGKAVISTRGLDSLQAKHNWQDYFKGILREFASLDGSIRGLNVYIESTLPAGSGLSSSASITTGFATLLNDVWRRSLSREQIVLIAQRAENSFVGVACGILDQYAIAMGQQGQALLLDCASMVSECIPFPDASFSIVSINTGVKRQLAQSDFNLRQAECVRALALLKKEFHVNTLSEVSMDQILATSTLKDDAIAIRRARHVVSENARVLAAAAALKAGEIEAFGQELYASHQSLRDDFEVSCKELDIVVDESRKIAGVAGAKMTGAGFGGSAIAIVQTASVAEFTRMLGAVYRKKSGLNAVFHECTPASGVRRLGFLPEQSTD